MRLDCLFNLLSVESFRFFVYDESRWDMLVFLLKFVLLQLRWLWDKFVDFRIRGKNYDDFFRKDKENVVKFGFCNIKIKVLWEILDINQVQQMFKKDLNDIFRKDLVLKEKNIYIEDNGLLKVFVLWEMFFGKFVNDFDVLFGKFVYGKS